MRWLSLQSPTSWRDVPAAEAWPPSSEPGLTAPRMIVPVVSPRGLSLVPSRSFASGCGGRCPCSQVGGLADAAGADRRARGLRGELYAGVGVALNCCARAHVLALLAIPDLMA